MQRKAFWTAARKPVVRATRPTAPDVLSTSRSQLRSAADWLPEEAVQRTGTCGLGGGQRRRACHLTCRLYEMTPYRRPLSRRKALTKPRMPHTRALATRPRPLHFLALPLPASGQASLLPGAWACDRGNAAAPSPKSRGLGRLRAIALARARVWGTGARVLDQLPLLAPWAPGTGSSRPSKATATSTSSGPGARAGTSGPRTGMWARRTVVLRARVLQATATGEGRGDQVRNRRRLPLHRLPRAFHYPSTMFSRR